MTDKEKTSATDNEIIKALKCCVTYKQICPETCPMVGVRQCAVGLRKKVLDLINRQKEQIESLIAGQETLQKYIAEKDKEIERLKSPCEMQIEVSQKIEKSIKSEAVKEFAERFLKKIHENHYLLSDKHNSTDKGMFTIGIEQAVNETKKEMVGDAE